MKDVDIKELVRPDLQKMVPYEPHLYDDVIKLDANENPYEVPGSVIISLQGELARQELNRYPDPNSMALREAIAEYTGLTVENIMVGNGSDELIQTILIAFGGPGARVVIPVPTFAMYKIHSTITGAEPVEIPLNKDYSLPVNDILKETSGLGVKITFLVSPNNPTGRLVPREEIIEVLEASPGIVVVDEAYYEFSRETCTDLLTEYRNLIILRTFSKFALAALRIGYLMANEEVVRELNRVKQPYNVNAFSQAAARIVLKKKDKFLPLIDAVISERERLYNELKAIPGITVYPSRSNFILFKTDIPAADVHRGLIERGVLIRFLGNGPGLENCMRVTVGKKEENDLFLEKLKDIILK